MLSSVYRQPTFQVAAVSHTRSSRVAASIITRLLCFGQRLHGFLGLRGLSQAHCRHPDSPQRVPRVVGVRERAGSGRRMGSPRGLWGETTPPVLTSVPCAYLPQMVGHTPRSAQTNRLGLATDCASDAPHHEEATRPS